MPNTPKKIRKQKDLFKFLENYYDTIQNDFSKTHRELNTKAQRYIKDNPDKDHESLISKLGQIYADTRDITSEMELLITQIDQNHPINLSDRELQRIQTDKNTRDMFDTFAPYFILYNFNKNLLNEDGTPFSLE